MMFVVEVVTGAEADGSVRVQAGVIWEVCEWGPQRRVIGSPLDTACGASGLSGRTSGFLAREATNRCKARDRVRRPRDCRRLSRTRDAAEALHRVRKCRPNPLNKAVW